MSGAVTRRCLLGASLAAGPLVASVAVRARAEGESAAGDASCTRTPREDSLIEAADGRRVRISTWAAVGARRGLILFSHGALSAPEKYERVIRVWNAAGYEVRAPLHVDSTDHADHAKYGMLESWRARLLDMRALAGATDVPSYIAAGHSYGALVALTLGGVAAEVPPGLSGSLRDMRASVVIAFSPPPVSPGLVTEEGFRTLAVPAFIQTGDRDIPFGSKDGRWQGHLVSYGAAPPGDKFSLVLAGVDHYFGGLICKPEAPGPAQYAQLSVAVSLSTLFMQAYVEHDAAALALLSDATTGHGVAALSRK